MSLTNRNNIVARPRGPETVVHVPTFQIPMCPPPFGDLLQFTVVFGTIPKAVELGNWRIGGPGGVVLDQ